MFALNQNQLWVPQSSYYNGSGAQVRYSSNGGINWSNVNTGLVSDSLNQVSYTDIRMSNTGIGFIIGSIYKSANNSIEGFILKTIDMGQTWTATKYPEERFQNILYISDNEWVVLGNQGDYISNNSTVIQRKTSDAGNSWIFSKPLDLLINNSYFYNSIYAPDTDVIYFFAIGGIYKSLDRGVTYQRITSDNDVAINEIAFDSKPINSDSQLGVAWLKWNTNPYLITYDGGQSWHKKSLPQSMGYIWLVGIAEEVIYMITDQNKLYKSTDLGETWNQLYLQVYSGLQALNVFSIDVLVLNAYKNLVSTTDGGSSWIFGPTLGNVWLEGTDITDPGSIIGVGTYYDSLGQKGCFFRTSDFGLSWQLTDTDRELKKITMIDHNLGYAIADIKFYKTSNAGNSWKVIAPITGYYRTFSTFAFFDSLNGIISTADGFKKTSDGGKVWTNKDFRIPFPGADKMEYNARGDLFMIAGASMIMLPSDQIFSPETLNISNESVSEYYLSPSFPNPFNSASTIKYHIPTTSYVTIEIFNTLGEEIQILVDEVKPTGTYEVTWNAKDLTSGVYFYKMQAGSFVEIKKMIFLK